MIERDRYEMERELRASHHQDIDPRKWVRALYIFGAILVVLAILIATKAGA